MSTMRRRLLAVLLVALLACSFVPTRARAATVMYSLGAYRAGDIPVVKTQGLMLNGKRLVALTFDDGPSKHTESILGILRQKGVRATFFTEGYQVDLHPDLARHIVESGNQIANHGYSHKLLTTADLATVRYQIAASQAAIERATGVKTFVFRSPYGSFSSREWNAASDAIKLHVSWDVDPQDWSQPGVSAIISRCMRAATTGGIVLLHEGGGDRSQTVAALPYIIDGLRSRGCEFVTIDELRMYAFGGRPLVPPPNAVYRFYNLANGGHFYTRSAEEAVTVNEVWWDVYA